MKSKAPLALIEMSVMVLVFALAAAVCVGIFARADRISRNCAERDRAVTIVQSAAETVRHCGGDLEAAAVILGGRTDGESLSVEYGADWEQTVQDSEYRLEITETESGRDFLGTAEIRVLRTADGTELFALTAAWQKAAD